MYRERSFVEEQEKQPPVKNRAKKRRLVIWNKETGGPQTNHRQGSVFHDTIILENKGHHVSFRRMFSGIESHQQLQLRTWTIHRSSSLIAPTGRISRRYSLKICLPSSIIMSVLMLNAQEMRNFINETMPTSTDENGRISRRNVFLVIRRR